MKAVVVAAVSTVCLVLLANRVQEIGERIPYVLLSVWGGSATIAALIFSDRCIAWHSSASAHNFVSGSQIWARTMLLIAASLLPLMFTPLLEIQHSGYDPALLLMNGVLIVSICGAPYFWLLARSIIGAVVLSICSLGLLWHLAAWALFS